MTQPSTRRLVIAKPIGEDLVPDLRILRLHANSDLARNPVLQLLFEVSKEPPGQGSCLLTTLMARLGKRSFLLFFHIPVGGCQDPSISVTALGRFIVTRFKKRKVHEPTLIIRMVQAADPASRLWMRMCAMGFVQTTGAYPSEC